ncbi:MAG: hypothetical protein ACKVT0_19625 [Planctomycetaceae bacterium]
MQFLLAENAVQVRPFDPRDAFLVQQFGLQQRTDSRPIHVDQRRDGLWRLRLFLLPLGLGKTDVGQREKTDDPHECKSQELILNQSTTRM